MGVTAHFFAFDPRVDPQPGMERWLERGWLDEQMSILGEARGWITEIHSYLGDNKQWNANLAADFAWSRAREHVGAPEREGIDRWLSHLFWAPGEGQGCSCGRAPTSVAEQELVYDDALLRHILSLEHDLSPVEDALVRVHREDPEARELFGRPFVHEYDGFVQLVWERQAIFERATKAGAGWSLLQWVWI